MRLPKFKVGDKVRVLRASTQEEYGMWKDSWMPSMNRVVGKVMTINYVYLNDYPQNHTLYPKYRFEGIGLNFPEFVLENEIQVGRQLLFDFMSATDGT